MSLRRLPRLLLTATNHAAQVKQKFGSRGGIALGGAAAIVQTPARTHAHKRATTSGVTRSAMTKKVSQFIIDLLLKSYQHANAPMENQRSIPKTKT